MILLKIYTIYKKFKAFIEKHSLLKLGIASILVGLVAFNITQSLNRDLKDKLAVANQNLKAKNDSLRVTKDQLERDEYNKLAYLTNQVNDLKSLNQDLYKEVKSIKGNVSSILQAGVKIVEKPVYLVTTSKVKDSIVTVNFKLDTVYSPGNYKKLSGYTTYNTKSGATESQKIQDETGVKITAGVKNVDKGKPEIFVKSDYPGLVITDIQGAFIDPTLFKKNKTPLITPSITIGWTPAVWNNQTQKLSLSTRSVGITAGLGFNLFKLLKLKK